ncbi:hypothetical protein QE390_005125 [Siphonobacter sp. SORGH_AS 1065]|nr:hypothetical protein [Siphonobacter sp. SORGH_AS_1065]
MKKLTFCQIAVPNVADAKVHEIRYLSKVAEFALLRNANAYTYSL